MTTETVIEELNKSVRKFYPIDEDIENEDFDGFYLLKKLIETKHDGLVNNAIPNQYKELVQKLQVSFPEYRVFAKYFKAFPSYSITITLFEGINNNIKITSCLSLHISLLTDYYTFFFEEFNWFKSFPKNIKNNTPTLIRILSSVNLNFEQDLSIKLNNIIQELFPNYNFARHDILLKYKLPNGVPLGYLDRIKNFYPLYSFLFDDQFDLPITIINP